MKILIFEIKILDVCASKSHIIVATENGVFCRGNSPFGQCGIEGYLDQFLKVNDRVFLSGIFFYFYQLKVYLKSVFAIFVNITFIVTSFFWMIFFFRSSYIIEIHKQKLIRRLAMSKPRQNCLKNLKKFSAYAILKKLQK